MPDYKKRIKALSEEFFIILPCLIFLLSRWSSAEVVFDEFNAAKIVCADS